MAGFNFFTSLASIFNAEWISSEKVTVKGRNSAVEETSLRGIREGGIEASRKQASKQLITIVDVAEQENKQLREARQARVDAAHATIAQKQQRRTAVINSDRKRERDEEKPKKSAPLSNPPPPPNKKQKTQTTPSERREKKLRQLMTPKFLGMSPAFQEITLKNNGIDNPQEAIKQMKVWAKEDAKKERLKAEEPPKTRVRQSVQDEWGVDLQSGDRVNILLMKHREQQEMRWWEGKAKQIFNNTDVGSVTIAKKGTLTREQAENLGWVRGDGNGGGGRGRGG